MAWNRTLRKAAGLTIGLLAVMCSCDSGGGPAGPADSGGPEPSGPVTTVGEDTLAAPPHEIAFSASPGPTLAGLYLAPIRVTALDPIGRADTRFEGFVTVDLGENPGSARLLGTTRVRAVDWSPDGRKVVFAGRVGSDSRKLFVANLSGGGPLQPLGAGPPATEDHEPAWTGVSP